MYWKTKWFRTTLGCIILLITQCAINSLATRKKYRKIPRIRAFLRGLILEGLMYGGKFASKSIGLASSAKEIYHFCFVCFILCIQGQIPSISPPGGLYSEGRFNGGFFALRFWGAYIWRGLYMEGLIFGILRYYPVEIMFIMEAHPWLDSVGFSCWFFSIVKYY